MGEPGFVIGNIAKGADLWDRENEIELITRALEKNSVLLKAPRRFGKTSIMYRIYEEPPAGYTAFFHDTEEMRTPQELISWLVSRAISESTLRSALSKASGWLRSALEHIDEISAAEFRLKLSKDIADDWQEKGRDFIEAIKGEGDAYLFILDELPMFIQNIAANLGNDAARDFLQWFRSIRQMPDMAQTRWLVGGSIGIEHVVEEVGAGTKTINDFQIMNIDPFKSRTGQAYIRALLKNEGGLKRIDTIAVEHISELIGAHVPYFTQILVYESLIEMRRRGRRSLDTDIIDTAYREGVLGPASRTYFEHYFTRLKDYYGEDVEPIAKRLILETARRKEVARDDLFKLFQQLSAGKVNNMQFSYLMTDLENDFYVAYNAENGTYRFTTNVLRDWWLRFYDLVED